MWVRRSMMAWRAALPRYLPASIRGRQATARRAELARPAWAAANPARAIARKGKRWMTGLRHVPARSPPEPRQRRIGKRWRICQGRERNAGSAVLLGRGGPGRAAKQGERDPPMKNPARRARIHSCVFTAYPPLSPLILRQLRISLHPLYTCREGNAQSRTPTRVSPSRKRFAGQRRRGGPGRRANDPTRRLSCAARRR